MRSSRVPAVDLRWEYDAIRDALEDDWASIIERGDFVLGRSVLDFERRWASRCGVGHCVGVGNGTDALAIALRAMAVRPGDEVILPANTFVATAEAVSLIGARPVLVDIDPETLAISHEAVAALVGPRTKAVIPVHLFGTPVDVEMVRVAVGPSTPVLEDASQAHGASYRGRAVGSLGDAATFSFYPAKNLGAFGDAGALVTGSEEIAERARAFRNHGGVRKYEHESVGANSRLDSLQAAVLIRKLDHLDSWNAKRRQLAAAYRALLPERVCSPLIREGVTSVFHQYVVQSDDRDELLAALLAAGIDAGIHYPRPIHLLPAFSFLGYGPGDFPASESAARRILSLPIHPSLDLSQVEYVCERVLAFLGGRS